jgi:hypothetical protein
MASVIILSALVPGVLMSLGAIYAFIPIFVIVALVGAAAGLTRGSDILTFFGIEAVGRIGAAPRSGIGRLRTSGYDRGDAEGDIGRLIPVKHGQPSTLGKMFTKHVSQKVSMGVGVGGLSWRSAKRQREDAIIARNVASGRVNLSTNKRIDALQRTKEGYKKTISNAYDIHDAGPGSASGGAVRMAVAFAATKVRGFSPTAAKGLDAVGKGIGAAAWKTSDLIAANKAMRIRGGEWLEGGSVTSFRGVQAKYEAEVARELKKQNPNLYRQERLGASNELYSKELFGERDLVGKWIKGKHDKKIEGVQRLNEMAAIPGYIKDAYNQSTGPFWSKVDQFLPSSDQIGHAFRNGGVFDHPMHGGLVITKVGGGDTKEGLVYEWEKRRRDLKGRGVTEAELDTDMRMTYLKPL